MRVFSPLLLSMVALSQWINWLSTGIGWSLSLWVFGFTSGMAVAGWIIFIKDSHE